MRRPRPHQAPAAAATPGRTRSRLEAPCGGSSARRGEGEASRFDERRGRARRARARLGRHRRGIALVVLLAALGPAPAGADALPYDEATERETRGEVVIVGLDRAPDHAVILYPSRCTRSIQILFVEDDRLPELQEELAARAQEDRRDYQELREGEPFRFLRGDNYCPDSAIVAIPRGALLRRFKAATPKERRRLVDDEPAVLRSTLELPEVRPVVPKRSRLKSVRETLRIAGLTADALVVGVDAHDYTFRDGTTQRLAIGASARPELPQRPIADEVLAAADAGAVGWEARVLQDRSEKTGSMDGRESGDEAATAPPEIDATAGSKDGGTPSAIAAGASDEGDPSAIAAGASDEAATSAGSATSAAASSDASSDEAAPATAGTPTSGTTSAVQSRPPATSAEVDDASVEEDAEEDEDTDDEPPGRRLRLWITALLAGLVSLGSLWWIRRDRR